MRLFIAIRLTEEMRAALIEVQNQMYEGGVKGNYSSEENLHLTLAFIGEYPDPEAVIDALETVSFTPFEIVLEGAGNFGNLWWAGIRENPALKAVVRRVRRALADAKIPFDKKAFRAHITLIRKAKTEHGIPPLSIPNVKMDVDTISLMRSDRGKGGMIYTEVGAICAEWKGDIGT